MSAQVKVVVRKVKGMFQLSKHALSMAIVKEFFPNVYDIYE